MYDKNTACYKKALPIFPGFIAAREKKKSRIYKMKNYETQKRKNIHIQIILVSVFIKAQRINIMTRYMSLRKNIFQRNCNRTIFPIISTSFLVPHSLLSLRISLVTFIVNGTGINKMFSPLKLCIFLYNMAQKTICSAVVKCSHHISSILNYYGK